MKIGITCYPTYGGSGVVATELGKALARKGHEVHFITYALPMRLDTFQENIFYHEVDIPTYPVFEHQLYTLALTGKMVDVMKFEKLDILHVHYAIPHAVSGLLARQISGSSHPVKLVTTLHGTDITLIGLEPEYLPLVKYSIEQSDAVTCVSRFLREKTLSHFQIDKEIDVIPNFIDSEVYFPADSPSIRNRFAPNGEKLMVHVSNFREVKRVEDTIYILQEVVNKVDTKLLLIGDGPERVRCERLCRDLGLCDRTIFVGKQSAIPELIAACDVFLLPSQSESFGLAALEAMACGLPVVATSSGGIPELVVQGETGYIAEMGDTKRMAKYVVEILTNEKRRTTMAEASLKRARNVFGVDNIVPMYEKLYESLLEK